MDDGIDLSEGACGDNGGDLCLQDGVFRGASVTQIQLIFDDAAVCFGLERQFKALDGMGRRYSWRVIFIQTEAGRLAYSTLNSDSVIMGFMGVCRASVFFEWPGNHDPALDGLVFTHDAYSGAIFCVL